MASLTWWMWVCVNSGSWWWTGRPGVLRFMGSQRVGHDWATELNWTELNWNCDMQFQPNIFTLKSCSTIHGIFKYLQNSYGRIKLDINEQLRQGYVSTKAKIFVKNCSKKMKNSDFPVHPVVKILPSNVGSVGPIFGWGAKIPHALWPKN